MSWMEVSTRPLSVTFSGRAVTKDSRLRLGGESTTAAASRFVMTRSRHAAQACWFCTTRAARTTTFGWTNRAYCGSPSRTQGVIVWLVTLSVHKHEYRPDHG